MKKEIIEWKELLESGVARVESRDINSIYLITRFLALTCRSKSNMQPINVAEESRGGYSEESRGGYSRDVH